MKILLTKHQTFDQRNEVRLSDSQDCHCPHHPELSPSEMLRDPRRRRTDFFNQEERICWWNQVQSRGIGKKQLKFPN